MGRVEEYEYIVVRCGYIVEEDVQSASFRGNVLSYEDQPVHTDPGHLHVELIEAVTLPLIPCNQIHLSIHPLGISLWLGNYEVG